MSVCQNCFLIRWKRNLLKIGLLMDFCKVFKHDLLFVKVLYFHICKHVLAQPNFDLVTLETSLTLIWFILKAGCWLLTLHSNNPRFSLKNLQFSIFVLPHWHETTLLASLQQSRSWIKLPIYFFVLGTVNVEQNTGDHQWKLLPSDRQHVCHFV